MVNLTNPDIEMVPASFVGEILVQRADTHSSSFRHSRCSETGRPFSFQNLSGGGQYAGDKVSGACLFWRFS